MAGGEGVGLEVLKCFVRGGQNFSTCFVCGGVRFSTSPSVKKINDPLLLIGEIHHQETI